MQLNEKEKKIRFNNVSEKSLLRLNGRDIMAKLKNDKDSLKKASNRKVEECCAMSFQSRESPAADIQQKCCSCRNIT